MSEPPKKRSRPNDRSTDFVAAQTDDFETFLKNNGACFTKINFGDSECGKGMIANQRIEADEEFASIPLNLVLTEDVAIASPLGQAIKKLNLTWDEIGRYTMYVFMIHQKFCGGFYQTYLKSIPDRYTDPIWWSEEQRQAIKGSNLYLAVRNRQKHFKKVYKSFFPALFDSHPEIFDKDVFTYENFIWAHSAFASRGFPYSLGPSVEDLPKCIEGTVSLDDHKGTGCMLPMLDVSNHKYRAKISWIKRDGRLRFVAGEAVEKGEQIYNNYGPKGNEEFLVSYGFCLDPNPQDSVCIVLGCPDEEMKPFWEKARKSLELPTDHYLSMHDLPELFLPTFRLSLASQEQLQELGESDVLKTNFPFVPMSQAHECHMLGNLRSLLVTKLSAIPHPPNAKNASLAEDQEGNDWAKFCTRVYLAGQRNILSSVISKVETKITEISVEPLPTSSGFDKLDDDVIMQKLCFRKMKTFKDDKLKMTSGAEGMLTTKAIVTEAISAGDTVLSIPMSNVLSTSSKLIKEDFLNALSKVSGLDNDTMLLLLFLHIRQHSPSDLWKEASFADLSLPALWGRDQVMSLGLNNTQMMALLNEVNAINGGISELHECVIAPLQSAFPELFPEEHFNANKVTSAAHLIEARSIAVDVGNEKRTCVLPLPGWFRLHPRAPSVVSYDENADAIQLKTLVDLPVGSEFMLPLSTFGCGLDDDVTILCRFGQSWEELH
eukprot:TRINITY_DN1191_c0_g1_i1.p1 TRINITY_DN1191_c0_g1~~TRINITY_DN1191_c0_g1_i1.p1  ORF type:complete len:717 (+),score=170.75 TRINITY_DN1191_c0_g1_i1:39-2189(+)